jgi:hypothetical protein
MANEVLNITNICTNLQHSQLAIENLEMFISIYKSGLDDAHESMKQFMEMKNDMMEENEELINKLIKLGSLSWSVLSNLFNFLHCVNFFKKLMDYVQFKLQC